MADTKDSWFMGEGSWENYCSRLESLCPAPNLLDDAHQARLFDLFNPSLLLADSTCSCGGVYTNNAMESAHRLSNHLVKIGDIGRYPKGCVCCPAGRPVKAAEMRERMFCGRVSAGEVSPHKNYFVYARGKLGREHVYIGTKDVCAVGK